MADPWSTVPELRLNLGVYSLCMVGGLLGNILVISIMIREKTSRKLQSDSWKTNLFLLSLSVGALLVMSTNHFTYKKGDCLSVYSVTWSTWKIQENYKDRSFTMFLNYHKLIFSYQTCCSCRSLFLHSYCSISLFKWMSPASSARFQSISGINCSLEATSYFLCEIQYLAENHQRFYS